MLILQNIRKITQMKCKQTFYVKKLKSTLNANLYSTSQCYHNIFNYKKIKPIYERGADLSKLTRKEKLFFLKKSQTYYWRMNFCKNDVLQRSSLSPGEWKLFIETEMESNQRNHSMTPQFIEAELMNQCSIANNYKLAESYMAYLKDTNEPLHFLSLGFYLELLSKNLNHVSVDNFMKEYKTFRDDGNLPSKFHLQMLQTLLNIRHDNKEDIDFHLSKLDEFDQKTIAYQELAIDQLKHKGFDKGIEYLRYILSIRQCITNDCLAEYLKHLKDNADAKTDLQRVDTLCEVLSQADFLLESSVAKLFLEATSNMYDGCLLSIEINKPCEHCGTCLEELKVSKKEIEMLKECVAKKVVHKNDLYQTTTPEEWSGFLQFLKRFGPFKQVVDGLNILLGSDEDKSDGKNWLRQQKIRTLVIVRKHARQKLLKFYGGKIPSNIFVYYLDNVSKDDCFVLYGALDSGLGCKVFSEDFFRQHFNLIDKDLKDAFSTWQKLHHISLDIGDVYPYRRVTQWNEGRRSWHLPVAAAEVEYNHVSNLRCNDQWLCLTPSVMTKEIKPYKKLQYIRHPTPSSDTS